MIQKMDQGSYPSSNAMWKEFSGRSEEVLLGSAGLIPRQIVEESSSQLGKSISTFLVRV